LGLESNLSFERLVHANLGNKQPSLTQTDQKTWFGMREVRGFSGFQQADENSCRLRREVHHQERRYPPFGHTRVTVGDAAGDGDRITHALDYTGNQQRR
jgi:hypothetical protein